MINECQIAIEEFEKTSMKTKEQMNLWTTSTFFHQQDGFIIYINVIK
jgi:hypothetical protein